MHKKTATKIKVLRVWHELTQAQFGKKIGRSATSVSGWEAGHSRISQDSIERIESAFNIRLESIDLAYEPAQA